MKSSSCVEQSLVQNVTQMIIFNQNDKSINTMILTRIIFDPPMDEWRVRSLVHVKVKYWR